MSEINWPNLVAKGRAKAHGVPWSEEENAALALGIPADFVREGILTQVAYKKAQGKDAVVEKETGEKPLSRMNLAELEEKAKSLGLEFTPGVTKAALLEIINQKLEEEAGDSDSDSDNDE
jgi:hypothetical protein